MAQQYFNDLPWFTYFVCWFSTANCEIPRSPADIDAKKNPRGFHGEVPTLCFVNPRLKLPFGMIVITRVYIHKKMLRLWWWFIIGFKSIWVNYNISLTWIKASFGDDFPYWPWFPGRGRDVRSWWNLPRSMNPHWESPHLIHIFGDLFHFIQYFQGLWDPGETPPSWRLNLVGYISHAMGFSKNMMGEKTLTLW